MIALSLDDCRIKVSCYTQWLTEAGNALQYLRQPDMQCERDIQANIRTYQSQAQQASEPAIKELYLSLAAYAQEALKELPQHMGDDELAEAVALNKASVKHHKAKLSEALDEMGALQATPELFDEIRAQYSDLPPHAVGEPLFIFDNGTVLLMSGMAITAEEINIYRMRKVFGEVEVLDG